MKKFHIGDVLSITTGILVSPSGMNGIYRILNFMEGYSHCTHELVGASERCRPVLLRQHPQLAEVSGPPVRGKEWMVSGWVSDQALLYGEFLDVAPCDVQGRTSSPLESLAEAMSDVDLAEENA